MIKPTRNLMLLVMILAISAMLACSSPSNQPQPSESANKNAAPPPPAKKTTATGTISANPNPIKVCDGTGAGITTLTWSATGTSLVEVRMGSPDGGQFARTGPSGGTKQTAKWVGNGTLVYLQDVSDNKPLTYEYTIATLTIGVTSAGCP